MSCAALASSAMRKRARWTWLDEGDAMRRLSVPAIGRSRNPARTPRKPDVGPCGERWAVTLASELGEARHELRDAVPDELRRLRAEQPELHVLEAECCVLRHRVDERVDIRVGGDAADRRVADLRPVAAHLFAMACEHVELVLHLLGRRWEEIVRVRVLRDES